MTLTPDGGFPLAVARSCAVAGLLSAFGSLAFAAVVLAKVLPRNPDASGCEAAIRVLARWSLAVAMAGLLAWGVLQTADFAHSGADPAALARAWPVVLLHTAFGHVWLAQVAAVLAAGLALPRFPRVALALSAAAVLLQGGHSHAAAMDDEPSLLLASDLVHLAAAGAWLGGLAPLALVVRGASPRAGASAARWFSPLGKWCVTAMAATAGFQFWALVGGLPGLVGTAYGWVALAKFALLGVLFGFAVWNRYDLAPALLGADPEAARRRLVHSVLVQTGFGVATVLAAGVLSSLPPALHEQPVWPFSQRPSLVAMAEPELAAEIWQGTALAAGSAILLASLAWSRLRRVALAAPILLGAGALAWSARPHLALLLVDAVPTSYYASPTAFAATSIMDGAALYPRHCASCHGAAGRGDGPAAAGLPVPPADLTAGHLWAHSDGELFWWLADGIPAPDGTRAMPGFRAALTADQRWALIDAIRARNAGDAWRDTGAWPAPLRLPAFDVACPRTGVATTDDLRGRSLYVVVPREGSVAVLRPPSRRGVGWTRCTASDPAVQGALSLLLGQPAAGSRLLVDANGWLRMAKTGDAASEWDDPAVLAAALAAITAPLIGAGGGHHHG